MRSMRGFLLLICGFISALFAEKMQAKVTLPTIWGNHMVLQQRAEVRFSGTAKSNRKVTITTSWDEKKTTTTTDKEGNWTATVATPAAGGPYSIVFSDGEELTLSDILIGEVWFCSGQSNMEMPVRGFRGQPVYGSQSYIVSADSNRSLRLFTVKRSWSTRPKTDGVTGYWTPLSPKEVGDFSATAYFFGEQLQKTLGIPVGLIHCSWSASRIEAWMSRETLRSFDDVKLPDEDATDLKAYAQTPTLLWNAMVYPWQGVPVKGVIWYQGEANSAAPFVSSDGCTVENLLSKPRYALLLRANSTLSFRCERRFYVCRVSPMSVRADERSVSCGHGNYHRCRQRTFYTPASQNKGGAKTGLLGTGKDLWHTGFSVFRTYLQDLHVEKERRRADL